VANLLRSGWVFTVDKHPPRREVDVSQQQKVPNPARSISAGRFAATLRARLSYANVIASVALFIALGGTAAAAVTLGRDSVGSPQIRQEAVRSPEISTDAVRSPEIVSGGVRSSEIRNEGIKFADISTAARTALLGDVKIAEDDNPDADTLPQCTDLTACPDHLVLRLSTGSAQPAPLRADPGTLPSPGTPNSGPSQNWLIQAKLGLAVNRLTGASGGTNCGLVNSSVAGPRAVLDSSSFLQEGGDVALNAVVKKRDGNPTIALRCTSVGSLVEVRPLFAKITALEVGTVTGP
jgi:hypothetical protein